MKAHPKRQLARKNPNRSPKKTRSASGSPAKTKAPPPAAKRPASGLKLVLDPLSVMLLDRTARDRSDAKPTKELPSKTSRTKAKS